MAESAPWGEVVLVDAHGATVGRAEKLDAHRSGLLHRALSVFLINDDGEWLLQQRHPGKYHSGGLWSNACCSHPQPGRDVAESARERLRFEMGIDCPLHFAFSFSYRAEFDHGLIEHEFDHVFVGRYNGVAIPRADEVAEWRWMQQHTLLHELDTRPETYTVWLRICAQRVASWIDDPSNRARLG